MDFIKSLYKGLQLCH